MAGRAGGADAPDDGQNQILRGDAPRQFAGHVNPHIATLALRQALRRQHMLDFGRADAVRQRRERAVGGGMRIPADDGHARQGRALLRPDDVNDALAHVRHLELTDAEALAVLVQR